MGMNIAIDGPAGAGKSTIAKKLAKDLGFIYIDTGAMYRAMGYYFAVNMGIDLDNAEEVAAACPKVEVTIAYENGEQQVYVNGENLSGVIRTERGGEMASKVSVYPVVRTKLVESQQKLAQNADVIMDGRDIGTVVLPNAQVKIFLTASSLTRAKRRYDELTEKGMECNLEEIEKDIIERDYRDMNRETSPLKQAEDAVLVDTSDMNIDEVVTAIREIYESKK
ncbi:MAG: (d)CMP kinase [Roseburia sp.]|nr:(d)CMP kinase [Roseburia sp.]